jgi:hypothetical protein
MIWFNLSAAFFISEKETGVIKLKTHYFIYLTDLVTIFCRSIFNGF